MASARRRGVVAPFLAALVVCCALASSPGAAVAAPTSNPGPNGAFSMRSTGLFLLKTVNRETAAPGDTLVYTLVFFNNSGAAAENLILLDPLPAGVQFLDASAGGALAESNVVWTVGELLPGDSGAVSFRARVTGSQAPDLAIRNQAIMTNGTQAVVAASNVVVTAMAAPPSGTGFTGTYKLIINATNPTSITVDPRGSFTVATVPGDGLSLGEGAQGTLNADGTFQADGYNGRASFTGQVDPHGTAALVVVHRRGFQPYTVSLPRTPDFMALPGALVGTFSGSATNSAGDRFHVLLTIDPEGNSTFQGDLAPRGPRLRFRTGSYQVTPAGQLGFDGVMAGMLQPETGSLRLTYQWIGDSYRSTFQVPLSQH